MGRTLPSAMQVFDGEAARWAKFRRALRREDQIVLDELFLGARRNTTAMAYLSNAVPMESILLAMLISTARRLGECEKKLRGLEDELRRPAGGGT